MKNVSLEHSKLSSLSFLESHLKEVDVDQSQILFGNISTSTLRDVSLIF